jgi:hypothetical protein
MPDGETVEEKESHWDFLIGIPSAKEKKENKIQIKAWCLELAVKNYRNGDDIVKNAETYFRFIMEG